MRTNGQHKGNGVGRPRAKVDEKILGNLAYIGCTIEEIGSILNVSARTLKRNFAEIIQASREKGKASLRKKMYEKAGLDSLSIANKIQETLNSNIVLAKNKSKISNSPHCARCINK